MTCFICCVESPTRLWNYNVSLLWPVEERKDESRILAVEVRGRKNKSVSASGNLWTQRREDQRRWASETSLFWSLDALFFCAVKTNKRFSVSRHFYDSNHLWELDSKRTGSVFFFLFFLHLMRVFCFSRSFYLLCILFFLKLKTKKNFGVTAHHICNTADY